MKNLLLISLVMSLSFMNSLLWGYNWPVSPRDSQHSITGTLGEFRPGHLHAGVDIGETNVSVYAIEGGMTEIIGGTCGGVRISRFTYCHIAPAVSQGQTITAGQRIGTITGTHLHLEESGGSFNPLRSDGLDNFIDTAPPTIFWIDVVEQGTERRFPADSGGRPIISALSGLVDIKVNAKDSMSLGSDTVGVYKIGYRIYNSMRQVIGSADNIKFDSVLGGNVNLVYAPGSTMSNYIYWVTNSLKENMYFSSFGLMDGVYYVSSVACDLRGVEYCIEASRDKWLEVGVDRSSPKITSYFPTGTGVDPNIGTISFTVEDPLVNNYASGVNGGSVFNSATITPSLDGYWSYQTLLSGGVEARFTIYGFLPDNTTFTVSVGGITDLGGNTMVPYQWTFTTVSCDVCEEWDALAKECKPKKCEDKPCHKNLGCKAETGECEYEPECDFSCEVCDESANQCVAKPGLIPGACEKCVNGKIVPCDKCESCNPDTGRCEPINVAVVCSDNNLCTIDVTLKQDV